MIQPEDLVEGEWAEWYRLTAAQRWSECQRLWQNYLALGGSLDPEPDSQSPISLPDLVQAKKTQRDKDWPMIRRLVEAHYFERRSHSNAAQTRFRLQTSDFRL